MAQSLEKRMTDIEYIIAHLPDDLNARFAGVDVKIATIRETQLLHTQRFSTLERKIDALEIRMDGLKAGWSGWRAGLMGLRRSLINLGTKVDLILARLPSTMTPALEPRADGPLDLIPGSGGARPRLFAGIDPVRADPDAGSGAWRRAHDRVGKHRGDECSSNGQQETCGGDAGARRAERHGGGADRALLRRSQWHRHPRGTCSPVSVPSSGTCIPYGSDSKAAKALPPTLACCSARHGRLLSSSAECGSLLRL